MFERFYALADKYTDNNKHNNKKKTGPYLKCRAAESGAVNTIYSDPGPLRDDNLQKNT